MQLTITPEVETFIQRKLDSGEYESPEQVIENAIHRLAQDDDKLGMTLAAFEALLEEGWDAAEKGQLVTPNELEMRLTKLRTELERA